MTLQSASLGSTNFLMKVATMPESVAVELAPARYSYLRLFTKKTGDNRERQEEVCTVRPLS
ncbi:MAG: hypothetical protein R3C56_35265 [Pirellulaceae bacterium]